MLRLLRSSLPFAITAVGLGVGACMGAVVSTALAQTPTPTLTALRFKALVDPTGRTIPDAVVVVQADTVVRVGRGAGAIPAGARVIDLRRYTAIPGLIDVHTHITYWRDKANPSGPPPRSRDSVVMLAAENARRTLETGVTTVRDLGATNFTDIAMRDSIAKGAMIGPRLFVSGHGLGKLTAPPAAGAPSTVPRGRVRDTVEMKEAIRIQVEAGADWIKMYGSTGSFQNVTSVQTFTDDEMRVATETAHRYGKPIAIHSYGAAGARGALLAGAESIEHPAGVDDATLRAWAARGTMYVPTIDHNRFYSDNAALLGYNAEQVAGLDSFRLLNLATAARAHRAGVKFAMGSDAVYWMFGENTRELAWFVKAGLSPREALQSATTNAAALLRMPTKLGRVAAGYYADIVAVDGDPLQNVDVVINKVVWVMKGGAVVVDKRSPLEWEAFAIRYATLPAFRVSGLVAGADTARRLDIACMVWLLKGPDGRTVLVDAGFQRHDLIARWKPTDYQRPDSAVARAGVNAASVTDVIISHVHWDHFDGADLFPNAKIWIQRDEVNFHIDSTGKSINRAIDAPDAAMLHALRAAGRLALVDGDAQSIIPGITVYTGGKHTFQSQYVGVRTAQGTVIIASDNMYLYENLDRQLPIAQTLDPASNLAAQRRMATLATSPRLVVPGHDPAVFTRFQTVARGVVRIR